VIKLESRNAGSRGVSWLRTRHDENGGWAAGKKWESRAKTANKILGGGAASLCMEVKSWRGMPKVQENFNVRLLEEDSVKDASILRRGNCRKDVKWTRDKRLPNKQFRDRYQKYAAESRGRRARSRGLRRGGGPMGASQRQFRGRLKRGIHPL